MFDIDSIPTAKEVRDYMEEADSSISEIQFNDFMYKLKKAKRTGQRYVDMGDLTSKVERVLVGRGYKVIRSDDPSDGGVCTVSW